MSRPTIRPPWTETGLLLGVATVVYVADRLTKAWVVANVDIGQQVSALGDLVQIWHTENEGAAFGLLQGGGVLFIVVGLATLGAIAWFHVTGRVRGSLAAGLLGLILGGTLGNLTDRLVDGSVTDFVSVGIGSLRWPTWNVADASVVVGIVGLVVLLSVLDRRAVESAT